MLIRELGGLIALALVAACSGEQFQGASTDDRDPSRGDAGDFSKGGTAAEGGNSNQADAGTPNGGKPGMGSSPSAGGSAAGGQSPGGQSGEGGASAGSGNSGGAASGSGGQGGSPGGDTECPASAPAIGAPCRGLALCSYGDDPRLKCRQLRACAKDRWVVPPQFQADCPDTPLCTNASTPAIIGKKCDPPAVCFDADSPFSCGCVPCPAGTNCDANNVWDCSLPSKCPNSPANTGQPCSTDKACSYGVCGVESGVETSCKDGRTIWRPLDCP